MHKSKNLRGSSSQQAAVAEAKPDPLSVIRGRRHRSGALPPYSADNRPGNLWSIADYTHAVYTSIDKH